MRSIYTLLFLLITVSVLAQSADTDKVVIINCWGHKKQTDTVPKAAICKVADIENGLARKMSCWNIVTNKDTLKAVSGCKIGGVTISPKDSANFKSVKLIGRYRDPSVKNDPMLILDGVVKDFEFLSIIDPSDIQNVEIIKPVIAMAKYGPDAANGAILITSKKQEEICACKKPYICGTMRRYMQQHDSAAAAREPVYSHKNCIPVYVVDGDVVNEKEVSRIDLSAIENISIIKGDEAALLYGCEGKNHGVIIIKIKNQQPGKLIVKDKEDGRPVAGATVLFVSRERERKYFTTDTNGIALIDKLTMNKDYEMTVSASGYILEKQNITTDTVENRFVFIERKITECGEVIVRSAIASHRIRCYFGWGNPVTEKCQEKKTVLPSIHVYPNPVQRNTLLNLQFDNNDREEKIIRLVNLDGKIIWQQAYTINKGRNNLQLPADARWAAGIYFVQLLYENGRLIASEKIIIQ